jgi:hypothetical protein
MGREEAAGDRVREVPTAAGGSIQSPWFTAEEAAAYLRIQSDPESKCGPLHAFYLAYRRMGIRPYRLRGGRGLRFHQDDLDAALARARVEPSEDRQARRSESGLTAATKANPRSHRGGGRKSAA